MKRLTAKEWGRALYEFTKDLQEAEAKKALKGFVLLLVRARALKLAPALLDAFSDAYHTAEGGIEIAIKSARPIPKLTRELKEFFSSYGKVSIKETLEPELLGGAVIQWGDARVDASLARRLRDLEMTLNV
ncbi:MAG: F0F1 ATP synthase subunit delta [Patescibacteria group bacterium]